MVGVQVGDLGPKVERPERRRAAKASKAVAPAVPPVGSAPSERGGPGAAALRTPQAALEVGGGALHHGGLWAASESRARHGGGREPLSGLERAPWEPSRASSRPSPASWSEAGSASHLLRRLSPSWECGVQGDQGDATW